jgi:hypothetical protein
MSVNSNDKTVLQAEMESFLKVSSAEISLSLKDSSESIKTLTKTFMEMVRDVHEIKVRLEALNVEPSAQLEKKELVQICDTYLDKVQSSTVGFQFYDKLTQRLSHNSKSMNKLMVMMDRGRAYDQDQWDLFNNDMKKRYNTEKDRLMYEALMDGESINSAIKLATDAKTEEGSVELF